MKFFVREVVAGLRSVVGGEAPVIRSRSPFKVLIATILSARTRDENTAKVTAELFKVYKSPQELADAPIRKLESIVRSSGFYKVKARRIRDVSRQLVKEFGGKVPDNIEGLLSLPGVGHKTAACVLVYGYRKPEIPVDVHVAVMSKRLGLTKEKTPDKIRLDLMRKIPKKYWLEINNLMVKYGRRICTTRNPKCHKCVLREFCSYVP